MSPRRPQPAPERETFPSLDAVLDELPSAEPPRRDDDSHLPALAVAAASLAAVGAVAMHADPPSCGPTRADELQAHAPAIGAAIGRGAVPLVEVLRAIGLAAHTRVESRASGAMQVVAPAPLPLPSLNRDEPPPPDLDDAPPEVEEAPPPVSSPRVHARGAIRRVEPRPIARPGGRAPVHPSRRDPF